MKFSRAFTFLVLAAFLAAPTLAKAAGATVWCEYEEIGMMTSGTSMLLYTNGALKAWSKVQPSNWDRPSQPFYVGSLSVQECRYIAMWLAAADFINRAPIQSAASDGECVLRLRVSGRTRSAYLKWDDAELGHLAAFFHSLTLRARGDKSQRAKALAPERLMNKPLGDKILDMNATVSTLEKFVMSASQPVDLISEDLRFLSKCISADAWSSFIDRCFEQASGAKRRQLVDALTDTRFDLKERVSESCWEALTPVLARWQETATKS